jgi:hypothetical protein
MDEERWLLVLDAVPQVRLCSVHKHRKACDIETWEDLVCVPKTCVVKHTHLGRCRWRITVRLARKSEGFLSTICDAACWAPTHWGRGMIACVRAIAVWRTGFRWCWICGRPVHSERSRAGAGQSIVNRLASQTETVCLVLLWRCI